MIIHICQKRHKQCYNFEFRVKESYEQQGKFFIFAYYVENVIEKSIGYDEFVISDILHETKSFKIF